MNENVIELIFVDRRAFVLQLLEQTKNCGLSWTQTTSTVFTSSTFEFQRSNWKYVISRSGKKYFLISFKDNNPHVELNSVEFPDIIQIVQVIQIFLANDGNEFNSKKNIEEVSILLDKCEPCTPSVSCIQQSYDIISVAGSTSIPASTGVLVGAISPQGYPLAAVFKTCTSIPCDLTYGTITQFSSDGSFTYVLNEGVEDKTDGFAFTVKDTKSETPPCVATLNILPNLSPSCVDKTYDIPPMSGTGGSPTSISASAGLLVGATDPEDQTLVAILKTCPSEIPCELTHGRITQFNSNGSFTYEPNEGVLLETDTFEFEVSDGTSEPVTCTVTLNILDNLPPSCVDRSFDITAIPFGGALNPTTIPASSGLLIGATDSENDSLTAVLETCNSIVPCDLTFGTITQFNSDGSFTFLPNEGIEEQEDTFEFRVSDGISESSVCTATLKIGTTLSPADVLAIVFIDEAEPPYTSMPNAESLFNDHINNWNEYMVDNDMDSAICLLQPVRDVANWDHTMLVPPSRQNLPPETGQAFPDFVYYSAVGRNDGRSSPLGNLTLEQVVEGFLNTAGSTVPKALGIFIDISGSMRRTTVDPVIDQFITWYEEWTMEQIGIVGCIKVVETRSEQWLHEALEALKLAVTECEWDGGVRVGGSAEVGIKLTTSGGIVGGGLADVNFNPSTFTNIMTSGVIVGGMAERSVNMKDLYSTGANFSGVLALSLDDNSYMSTSVNRFTQEWTAQHFWNQNHVAISGGGGHVMCIKAGYGTLNYGNPTLWSCGRNNHGQLGLGGSTPTRPDGHSNQFPNTFRRVTSNIQQDESWAWSSVACGDTHTMAIKLDGTLWACGSNLQGQLGLGDETERNILTQVGSDTWSAVACAGYGAGSPGDGYHHSVDGHTMAIKSDGTLWACGSNHNGELGLGDVSPSGYPEPCGISPRDGTDRNVLTQVSSDTWSAVACGGAPSQMNELYAPNTNHKAKHSCSSHSYAIKSDGTLWSCGSNFFGQLGLGNHGSGTPEDDPARIRDTLTQVGSDNTWSSIACGQSCAFAIKSDGTLWSCGFNQYGQLGLGGTYDSSGHIIEIPFVDTFTQVGSDTWSVVSSHGMHTMAIKSDGTLWGCGKNVVDHPHPNNPAYSNLGVSTLGIGVDDADPGENKSVLTQCLLPYPLSNPHGMSNEDFNNDQWIAVACTGGSSHAITTSYTNWLDT